VDRQPGKIIDLFCSESVFRKLIQRGISPKWQVVEKHVVLINVHLGDAVPGTLLNFACCED
jgi:hypothetical protein